ncbi:flagellar hook-associated protein [Yersinia alsatica]|uniref:flagellar hook-associated protein n=1 Tax=Yersinia alsatica TaxID=2890317 RepID=UPI0011A4E51A|nr:flagellar hook-associated protein [Yersinia alsatica]
MSLGINKLQSGWVNTTSAPPLNTEKLSRIPRQRAQNYRPDFPDSPFISNRPLRYNVQLNQQLTAVQQADDYLLETERQISQLHRAVIKSKFETEVRQLASKTNHWLQNRVENSAGTIDRQLNASPERAISVKFTLDNANKMVQSAQAETVLFSLSDHSSELVAVRFPAGGSPEQNLMRLNKGLGRLGIHGKADNRGEIHFSIAETRWSRISQHLTVKGEGIRFAAGSFKPLAVQAEETSEDKLLTLTRQPYTAGSNATFEQVLGHLTRQLQQLNEHKDQVRVQIASLSCFEQPGSALRAATALAQKLINPEQQYIAQARMMQVMSNLHISTVKNVLCE